jgi:hypothetical protein
MCIYFSYPTVATQHNDKLCFHNMTLSNIYYAPEKLIQVKICKNFDYVIEKYDLLIITNS